MLINKPDAASQYYGRITQSLPAQRQGEDTKYTGDFIAGGVAFIAGTTLVTGPVGLGILVVTAGYYILDVTTDGFWLDYSPKKQTNK